LGEDAGLEVAYSSFYTDVVDGMFADQSVMWHADDARSTCMPQRRVPCSLQFVIDSKSILDMVLLLILQWWRLEFIPACISGRFEVGRQPIALVCAENPRDYFVFSIL
jgi:hypothetical protein